MNGLFHTRPVQELDDRNAVKLWEYSRNNPKGFNCRIFRVRDWRGRRRRLRSNVGSPATGTPQSPAGIYAGYARDMAVLSNA